MAFERTGESPIDYFQCRYGESKLMFRGPKRDTSGEYLAFIGSTETYGKYVEDPFPKLIEDQIGFPCVNFGAVNAGVDAFLSEETVMDICKGAKTTVIQAMGAQNMSNRFYSVHPRRNDRFLKASTLLKTIFREVDFSEFSFTRHMLTTLKKVSPDKFATVEAELKTAWMARMEHLLKQMEGPTVLLWIRDEAIQPGGDAVLGMEPLFIDAEMIATMRLYATHVIEVVIPEPMARDIAGMKFPDLEANVAHQIYGPVVHQMIADSLIPVLKA